MATWFTRVTIGALALASLSLNSCQKDESKVTINPSAAPKLTASTTSPDLVLTMANANTAGSAFTFTAADFGYQAAAAYTLQIDKKGGNFSSPQSFDAGTTGGTLSLTKAQLANAFFALGYAPGVSSQVDVRVVSKVGSVTQVSPVVTLTASPTQICNPNTFGGDWGIVGPAADGWPGSTPATATDRTLAYDCYSQTFKLRTTLTAGAFKFRANKDWGTNLGGPTGNYATGVALVTNGPDMVATAGTYNVTLTVTTDATGKVTGGTVKLVP